MLHNCKLMKMHYKNQGKTIILENRVPIWEKTVMENTIAAKTKYKQTNKHDLLVKHID